MELEEMSMDVLKKIMSKKLKTEEFEVLEGKLEYFEDVKGFHGEHGLLTIHCKVGKRLESYRFFYKGTIKRKYLFDNYFSKLKIFEREHYLQTVVLNKLEKAIGQRLTAECYLSCLNKFIVCEDLTDLGFERIRLECPDATHAKLVLDELASLHVASIVLEERTGKKVTELFPEMLFEPVFRKLNEEGDIFSKTNDKLLRHLVSKKSLGVSETHREPFCEWFNSVYVNALSWETKFRNCVLHGDSMVYNYMYQYNTDGKPVKAIIVDFQFSRISPPAVDFLCVLACQMTLEMENALFGPLSEFYYSSLSQKLSDHGLEANQVLSKKEFLESLEHLRALRACVRLSYTMFIHLPRETLGQVLSCSDSIFRLLAVGDLELIDKCFEECESYKHVVTESLQNVYRCFKLSN